MTVSVAIIAGSTSSLGNLSATLTPTGGTAINMTKVKQIVTTVDTPFTATYPNAMATFVVQVPASLTTATQGVFKFSWDSGAGAGRMEGNVLAVRNLNPALVDFAVNGAARGTNSNSPMPITIDKPAKGLVVANAFFSTSGGTFNTAAYEVPTATALGAAAGLTNNQATPTWTGFANTLAAVQIEATGSGGGTLLAVSFAPAN